MRKSFSYYEVYVDGDLRQENAIDRIARNILGDINHGQDLAEAIALVDCSELHSRRREAWLVPMKDCDDEEVIGFTVYLGHYTEDELELKDYYLGSVTFG